MTLFSNRPAETSRQNKQLQQGIKFRNDSLHFQRFMKYKNIHLYIFPRFKSLFNTFTADSQLVDPTANHFKPNDN
jgi:hypothetical protein